MTTQLSWHFTLEDLTRSETASRKGIDNTPPEPVLANLKYLAEGCLEHIYQMVEPFWVTSVYRCPELNAAVGSKPGSAHTKGLAADIYSKIRPQLEFAQIIATRGFEFDQLIYEFGGWVHIAMPEPGKSGRRQLWTTDTQGTREGLHPIRPKLAKTG